MCNTSSKGRPAATYNYSTRMATASTAAASGAPTRRRPSRDAEVLEKDDTEILLEKALFGDAAGFLDSLSAARYGQGKELQTYVSGSDASEADGEEEDLADVPDEDV